MTRPQLDAYDHFLDENDWDIYYWTTQTSTPTSHQTPAQGSSNSPRFATPSAQGKGKSTRSSTGKTASEATAQPHVEGQEDMNPGGPAAPTSPNSKQPQLETDAWRKGAPRSGEWAQTVGAFKPAYRPVPARWKNSEILSMLRKHVIDRSAGGVHEKDIDVSAKVDGRAGGGLGFMPPLKNFDT